MGIYEIDKNKFTSGIQKEAALAATKSRNLDIKKSWLDNYGAMRSFRFENQDAVTILVSINGVALGDDTISDNAGQILSYVLKAGYGLEIKEEDNILINSVAITNQDAATPTTINLVVWNVANY